MRICLLAALPLLLGSSALAQEPARLPPDTTREQPTFAPQDTVAAALSGRTLTPGRAFVRSLLVPGWGQFSQGAVVRGAVYASLQTASAFMLVKTQLKINDARDEIDTRRAEMIDSMTSAADTRVPRDTAALRRLANPDTARALADSTAYVSDKRSLLNARRRQREDWIAQAIFITLASAVDAYVGAHLADFPGMLRALPARRGGILLEWTLPWPALPRPNGSAAH